VRSSSPKIGPRSRCRGNTRRARPHRPGGAGQRAQTQRGHSRDRTLQKDLDSTALVVHDNGRGFDPQQPHTTPEVIAEAVRDLGGRLTIESSPGRGVRLEITVPVRRPALQQVAS